MSHLSSGGTQHPAAPIASGNEWCDEIDRIHREIMHAFADGHINDAGFEAGSFSGTHCMNPSRVCVQRPQAHTSVISLVIRQGFAEPAVPLHSPPDFDLQHRRPRFRGSWRCRMSLNPTMQRSSMT